MDKKNSKIQKMKKKIAKLNYLNCSSYIGIYYTDLIILYNNVTKYEGIKHSTTTAKANRLRLVVISV